jgi:putative ABC transport system permease protein
LTPVLSGSPRLAEALLRLVLPEEDAETIRGDLEEAAHRIEARSGRRAARRWYWRQTASIVWARLFARRHASFRSDRKGMTAMSASLRQDVSYAARSLRKQPGFTGTCVLLLGLGIGANVAIFSLVHAVLFRPLPFPDSDRLMLAHMLAPDPEAPGVPRPAAWSYPKYRIFAEQQRVFEATAAFRSTIWNITGTELPERATGELVEAAYFDLLGIRAHIGRTFSSKETEAAGSEPLALLAHGFWMRRFGGVEGVVGRTIGLSGIPHTIVGVLPPGFSGLTGQAEVWAPLTTLPAGALGEAWNHAYTVVGRRTADTSVAQAQAATNRLGALIQREFPDPFDASAHWSATAVPLDDERADPLIRRSLLLLLAAVAALLVIVCMNVASLMFARALARQREVAIRIALGASRLRIFRQLMTESLLLALVSAAAGMVVAYVVGNVGASLMPDLRLVLPRAQSSGLTRVGLSTAGLDATVLLFALGAAAVAALAFGIGPAWRASRRDLSGAMKSGSAGAVSPGSRGVTLRNLMIVGELALALVLLASGGLMVKSVVRLQSAELGFDPGSLLTVRLALPAAQYTPARATQFFEQLLERLGGRPELSAVAYGTCAPVSGGCNVTAALFPDRPPVARGSEPQVGVLWASPAYFEALGIRRLRGRVFSDRDRTGQPRVVVINEAAARAFWGNEDPIGKRIGVGQGGFQAGAEVVGVVADVRYGAVEQSVQPDVYLPLLQSARSAGVMFIRTRASTAAVVPVVRADVQALDPDLPLTDIKMMDERFGEATWRTRMSAWLLAAFATLALLVAALGVYGVISQRVQQRMREVGVRMALGARRADILRMIIWQVVRLAVAGILLGVLLAIPATRLLGSLLYQVAPGDPAVFATLAAVLLAVAMAAGYVPARRATRVDPLTTLRAE